MLRKCLAIGVCKVRPVNGIADDFPHLDGAVIAAHRIGEWARNSGFGDDNVIVLTDETTDVTDATLQGAFTRLLPPATLTDHLVVAFAGHGLTGINDDITYWLLSDSLSQGYSIFVEDLRRQLYAYGIRKLTIFSDACRAIALSNAQHQLVARPGVSKRHEPKPPGFEVARYNACQDTEKAFMVRKKGSRAPGKCIFSGVLLEALWGRIPEAFNGDTIDSSSLGRGLKTAVGARAKEYDVELTPDGAAFFDAVIYFDKKAPPLPPKPELEEWPPSEGESADDAAAAAKPKPGAIPVFNKILIDKVLRDDILGPDFGVAHPDIDTTLAFPGLPKIAKSIVESVAETRKQLRVPKVSFEEKARFTEELNTNLKTLEVLAAGEARKHKAEQLNTVLHNFPDRAKAASGNLIVEGEVTGIWSDRAVASRASGPDSASYFDIPVPGQIIVEYADGLHAPVYIYGERTCLVVRDTAGVVAVSYHTRTQPFELIEAHAVSSSVNQLLTGNLTARQLDDLATELRWTKHVNPTFGAIAAYCYDVIGDTDSIKRMAAYYALSNQPAPYDLIFMGLIDNNGSTAHVLAVEEGQRRTGQNLPVWLVAPTPETDVEIAGRCPWLRQGWDFISSPEDAEMPLAQGLDTVRPFLQPSLFTTLNREGGDRLIRLWGMSQCLQK